MPGDDRPQIGTDSAEGFDDLSEVTVRIPITRNTPMRRQAKATLRVVAGRDMLQFVTIAPNEQIVIGRDEAAQLKLTDITVSKRHARVVADADGNTNVIDLNSTNGTAVNGRQVSRHELRPGDHLEVGGVSLRLDTPWCPASP